MGKLSDLTAWANEIISYAQDAALNHGKQWRGWKVVEGRSVRKYSDEQAVIEAANEAGYHDIFRKSLIPLTEMEKLMVGILCCGGTWTMPSCALIRLAM